mgnify:CR=1 FL=1
MTSVFKGAEADFKLGKYTSPRVLVLCLPVVFIVVVLAIILTTPSGKSEEKEHDEGAEETKGEKPMAKHD